MGREKAKLNPVCFLGVCQPGYLPVSQSGEAEEIMTV